MGLKVCWVGYVLNLEQICGLAIVIAVGWACAAVRFEVIVWVQVAGVAKTLRYQAVMKPVSAYCCRACFKLS